MAAIHSCCVTHLYILFHTQHSEVASISLHLTCYKFIIMKKYTSLFYPAIILLLLLLGNNIASAQKLFKALPQTATASEVNALKKVFKKQTIVQIDAKSIYQYIKQAGRSSNIIIDAGGLFKWDIYLEEHELRSPDYLLQRTTSKGVETMPWEALSTYAGYLKGNPGNYVRLNIHDIKLSGNIIYQGKSMYIEPLKKFLPTAADDRYIVYQRGDTRPVEGYCSQVAAPAAQQVDEKMSSLSSTLAADCRIIEIATESDWENYNQGIRSSDIIANLNFVEPLYLNYYGAGIVIKYQHEWATSADPYSANAICVDGADRLNEFTTYWQNNYTWVKRDLNILYSGVDFTGSTIGCAYVGVFNSTSDLCYAVAQWVPSYSDETREVLVAHEMGHIFNCDHDQTGCSSNDGPVMCPSINAACSDKCTPYWSTASNDRISFTMASANGSARLRNREFFLPVNTGLLLGLPYIAFGNNIFGTAPYTVSNSLFGNGTIIYSASDNITLLPGFSAVVAGGTGNFTAQIGSCSVVGQYLQGNQTSANVATASTVITKEKVVAENTTIQVYPNPFSSITNLEIALPKTANISVYIYDLAGRLVDNPVRNRPMQAGKNQLTYANNRLKANTYLLIVEIDGRKFTQKMIKI